MQQKIFSATSSRMTVHTTKNVSWKSFKKFQITKKSLTHQLKETKNGLLQLSKREMKKACTLGEDGYRVWLPAENLTGKVLFYRPSWADKRDLPKDYRTFGNADDESSKFQRTSTFIKDKEQAIAAAVAAGLLSSKEGKERMKALKDSAFKRLGI